MGIERLVPKMEDLAVMLDLLPRSATGQKLTVYTNLINAPRQPHDSDGPDERHIILVDNGRRDMGESPLAEALLCIRCGACLNACPVFTEIGGHAYVNDGGESSTYPGPIGSIVSPGLFGQGEFGHLARASSLCGACKEACPVDIDLPKLLLRVRAGGTTIHKKEVERNVPPLVGLGLRFYTWIASGSNRFTFTLKLAGLLSRIIAPGSDWMRLPDFTGWGYSKDLPRPAVRPFRERWAKGFDLGFTDTGIADEKEIVQIKSEEMSTGNLLGGEDLIQRFADELIALDGDFTLCSSADVSQRIFEELREMGISSILSWEGDLLPEGLIDALEAKGITIKEELDSEVKAGISGAEAAIAETGTLVLPSGRGKAQFVSLTPEVHFAVLSASDITQNLSEALRLPAVSQAAAVSLISGPSRTADIEMTLTLGVHGPRKLHVFCIDSE
jgi:L-lactate dehydrogenase complex protein LldF